MSTAKQLIVHSGDENESLSSDEDFFSSMLSPCALFELVLDNESIVSDYRLVRSNPAFLSLIGESEIQHGACLNHGNLQGGDSQWLEVFSRVAHKRQTLRFEYCSAKNNELFEVQAFSPKYGQFACLFVDITERRVAQRRLEESEGHFRTLVESIGEAIVCYNSEGKRTYVSPQYEKLTGVSSQHVIGKTILEDPYSQAIANQLNKVLQDVFLSGCESSCFYTQNHPIKGLRTLEIRFYPEFSSGGIAGVVSCLRDVTDHLCNEEEKNSLKQKLKEAERLAFVGQLASGLTMQINSPLALMGGLVTSLQDYLLARNLYNQDMRDIFSQHSKACLEIEMVMKGLKTFGQKSEEVLDVFDVHLLLEETVGMLQSQFVKNGLSLKKDFAAKNSYVKGYRSRMQQVFLNLITNAFESLIPLHKKDGSLAIYTSLHGKNLNIGFCDNGQGIAEHSKGKIFQAFFTTKTKGHSIGLGLAMSQHVIKEIGGDISFDSEVEKGAHFKVTLPIVLDPIQLFDNEEKRLKLASKVASNENLSFRVLLVDDEDSIRFVLANFLSDMGMSIDEAADAKEALQALKVGQYDFVLTDYQMPEMNGDELVLQAKKDHSDLKFISISADPNYEKKDLYHGFISKPFNLKAISQLFKSFKKDIK